MLTTSTSKLAILAAGVAILTPSSAFAQTAPQVPAGEETSNASGDGDIIVTAERRESTVQTTPIAITAFSGETMDKLQLTNASRLSDYVPGLNVATHGQVSGSAVVSIRGIGSTSVIGEPTVAFHVDGQYFAVGRSLNGTFYDLSRVEVLKGPQGTLYGRNSTAGVINVITARPENELKANFTALYGNYDTIGAQGMLNVPLVDNKLVARVAFNINKHDGYQKGAVQDIFDGNDFSVRGSILATPTENLTIHFVADYFKDDINGPGFVALNNPYVPAAQFDPFTNYFNTPMYKKQKTSSQRLNIDLDLGGVLLSSITGFSKDALNARVDSDGNNVQVGYSDRRFNFKAFQQELRASGDIGEFAEWQLGAFYYDETNTERFYARPDLVPTAGQPPVAPFIFITPAGQLDPIFNLTLDPNTKTTKSYAVYTQSKFHIDDTLTATLGLRWNRDKKNQVRVQPTQTDITEADFNSVTWKAGIDWQPNSDHLVYFNVSTGFKAGGTNEVVGRPNFSPEKVLAFELGWKGRLLDDRLRFSTAAFYYDYKDLQVSVVQNQVGLTANATGARIYGAEFDGRFNISDNFSLDASATYVNSKIGTLSLACPMNIAPTCPGIPGFFPSGASIDVSGSPLAQSPKLSAALGAELRFPMAKGGQVVARINYSYRSTVNAAIYADVPPFDVLKEGPTHNVDASLRYEADEERWFAEAFVNNLTNEERMISGQIIPPSGIYASYAPPRTYGVRIGFKFN